MMQKKNGFPIPTAKTDFTFLLYTPKNIYLKNTLFFNANLLEKFEKKFL